jgi:hypothetical protein
MDGSKQKAAGVTRRPYEDGSGYQPRRSMSYSATKRRAEDAYREWWGASTSGSQELVADATAKLRQALDDFTAAVRIEFGR